MTETEKEASKKFSKLLDHLRKAVVLLDEINRLSPNERLRQEVFDSLEIANKDVLRWRESRS